MPTISTKGQAMPASPIRKLVPFAEKAKSKGIKIYHLNIGQPDIATPAVALDAVKQNSLKLIEYSHSAGMESYRRKLAGYYQKNQVQVNHEQIIITTGGSEALLMGIMACLNPGDEIIIPEPFYANYLSFAISAGAKVVPVRSSIEEGFALPPVESFENLISSKTKAILISNPGNPTGYLYSKAELEKLRDIVLKHDLYLFSDEVYREFCYDGKTFFSAMQLEGLENNVILIDSVSKRYSMCGARVGAFITRNTEVLQTVLKFAQARLSPPTFGQIASEAALDTPDQYFTDVIKEYSHRRDVLVEGLNQIPDVFCPNPSGAFYAMVRLPISDSDHFCQWLLESFNYENETIMLAPATGFYSTPGAGNDEVRIGYVLNSTDLKRSVKILEEALKVYPHKTETINNESARYRHSSV
ncbi:MAG: pyridoxal phosphate-dependent aminotransferase [Bacteroidia bacterium]|nr:pyridoxal phosphate-dependent aminotransferase [Bacteroidia bacterium]